MKIYPIECGKFKLDGGAMFGVVPKSIWNKTNPADSNNMIDMSTRALLIEHQNRLILVDTGSGNKQSDKFFSYYYRWGDYSLAKSLAQYGFHPNDVTDVVFTHLHFDHCGGAYEWNKEKTHTIPAFKNAKYWSNQSHWNWATEPNQREKASFLEENILPIKESGQLQLLNKPDSKTLQVDELGLKLRFFDGHTESQMLPEITINEKTFVYMADLLPTTGHIPIPYVMGYDTRPLLTMEEKTLFLEEACQNGYFLILGHDAHHEIINLKRTEKGIRLNEIFTFDDFK